MSRSKNNKIPKRVEPNSNHLPLFDRSLPMMLKRAREEVMARFVPTLKKHDLSAEQWRAMRILDQDNGLNISELSRRCYVLKPSMSRILRNLEGRGLIQRKAVLEDQRLSAIFLTKPGRELINVIAPSSEASYKQITKQFGNKKLSELTDLLDDLMEALNKLDSKDQK